MGKFGALAIFMGLINDLFLLPAVLFTFKPRFKKRRPLDENRLRYFFAVLFLVAPTLSLAQDASEFTIKLDDLTNRTYQ